MKTLLKRSSGNASAWTLPWTKRVICGSSSSMSTPACGRRGDAKRVLVQRFFRHELLLKDWRHAVSGAGDGGGGRERQNEVISGAVGWMEGDEGARPIGQHGGGGGGHLILISRLSVLDDTEDE